ncbi:GTP-binding protein [Pisolithus marmoratus]|nr:GTP-binding protein [Pisolithus marmoratus]KAI6025459.1 GTP-binding protein [Pisolithus marmoratus]
MKNIKQFRVLVMGRANAGKTTILQRVCNSTNQPEIFDGEGKKIDTAVVQGTVARGYHNIEHELVFQNNPGFVFHDSCGFEAGTAQQFNQMKEFVLEHAASATINRRIHAIWFCIPMTDCHRAVTAAEQRFFNECDTGHVPVIVLLTKADALNLDVIQEFEDEGLEIEEAQENITRKERELLEKWCAHIKDTLDNCKFPPRGYVSLKNMDEKTADCATLLQCTTSTLNEEGLQRLLISTQQSNIAMCVEYAVKV